MKKTKIQSQVFHVSFLLFKDQNELEIFYNAQLPHWLKLGFDI